MTKEFYPEEPHFRITLRCFEERFPKLLEMYTFLHDFNLLYEISRVATDPNYDSFEFSDLVFSREEGLFARLIDKDRLRVESMSKKSPMELVTILAAVPVAIGAILGIIQIVEKVVNFRLNRRKLQEEIRKLERENSKVTKQLPTTDDQDNSVFLYENPKFLRGRLIERRAFRYYEMVGERLQESSIEIEEVIIEVYPQGRQGI